MFAMGNQNTACRVECSLVAADIVTLDGINRPSTRVQGRGTVVITVGRQGISFRGCQCIVAVVAHSTRGKIHRNEAGA